jgi:hypothetical protein
MWSKRQVGYRAMGYRMVDDDQMPAGDLFR